jgi:hypothetical protein
MNKPRWSLPLEYSPRGLSLARESGRLLIWDDHHWLFWTNSLGHRQAQIRLPNSILGACVSDEGSVFASAESDGRICFFAQDLQIRWARSCKSKPTAIAFDPLGILLAVAEDQGRLCLFDRDGQLVREVACPRAAHYLAFVPGTATLVAAADFGWLAAYDLEKADWLWRDTPVANVGGMAVAGQGEPILLAGFSEGVRGYSKTGQAWKWSTGIGHCRSVNVSYDGSLIVVVEMDGALAGHNSQGIPRFTERMETAPVALVMNAPGDTVYVALAGREIVALEIK